MFNRDKIFFITFFYSLVVWAFLIPKIHAGGDEMKDLQDITASEWGSLQDVTMYFGHQSVGENILDGIALLKDENQNIKLSVREGNTADQLQIGVLLQSKIGENGNPESKINAFKKIIDEGLGNHANIAFFKFCYIDFSAKTKPDEVFKAHKIVMDELEQAYPKTLFIHSTVPLVAIQHGAKTWIKKLLGKTLDGVNGNIVRNRYNKLLRKEYGENVIFDIARAESTKPGGNRENFTKDGEPYFAMYRGYTSDGGHLNTKGRKHVASTFLETLLEAADKWQFAAD